jgi:hypothetical protein
MKNYNDYIGKTFKGFEFENEKLFGIGYSAHIDQFIGKDLKIKFYDIEYNSFFTYSGFHYPADLVIEQLEKQKTEIENEIFKPKRGDRVLVWDNDKEYAEERIFLTEIEGAVNSYVCVVGTDEKLFEEGKTFQIYVWRHIKLLPKKVIPKDTLVWCKKNESHLWTQRFYSHFENGKHFCYNDQKKSNQTTDKTSWNIVTDKNPFE